MKSIVLGFGIALGMIIVSPAFAGNFDFSMSAVQREATAFRVGARYFFAEKTAASLAVGTSEYKVPGAASERRADNAHFLLGLENLEAISPNLNFRSGLYVGMEQFEDHVADPSGKKRKLSLIGLEAGIAKPSSVGDIKAPQIGFGVGFEYRFLPDSEAYYGGSTKLQALAVLPHLRFDF